MTLAVDVLDEPSLEFGYRQSVVDPHDGLTAFGPYDRGAAAHPRSLSLAVIGTSEGVARFNRFLAAMRGAIASDPERERLWPMYPGFEATFDCELPSSVAATREIDPNRLYEAARLRDPNRRVAEVVDLYLRAIASLKQRDETFHVVVCVVPDYVHKYCRPLSRVDDPVGELVSSSLLSARRKGQLELFEEWAPEIYDYSLDFRNQIKARSMEYQVPIQIIRESTLQTGAPETQRERLLTPLADRAWNLSLTMYYKAGGKPWRLMGAREGVCYIGLAYRRRDPSAESRSACCAAQMFLDTGDGIVFLGDPGPWYSPERRQFHLEPAAATRLLKGVLDTYRDQGGKELTEIFLHSHSGMDAEEFGGFRAACPPGVRLVGVRVQQGWRSGTKLYREGTRPVLRGTLWKIRDRGAYLWGSGFKPRLGTYDGAETPVPLRIDVQHGEAEIASVSRDILALTKLNYNACKLGIGEPVTIAFSKAVGEILVTNPGVGHALPQFKYYI